MDFKTWIDKSEMTVTEAADYFNVTRTTIYNWIEAKRDIQRSLRSIISKKTNGEVTIFTAKMD
jgi:transposase